MADEYIEYKTSQQSNVNLGETTKMTTKAPAVADRIFQTYQQAWNYIRDIKSSATAGLILSVINDNNIDTNGEDLNGIYQVMESKNPEDVDPTGHPLLYLSKQGPVQSDWLEEDELSMAYILHRPTCDYGTFTINPDGTVEETPYAEGYMDYVPPTNN